MKSVRQNSFLSTIISIIVSFPNLLSSSHSSQQCFQCLLFRIFLWSTVTFNTSDGQEIQNRAMWERIERTRKVYSAEETERQRCCLQMSGGQSCGRVLFPVAPEVTVEPMVWILWEKQILAQQKEEHRAISIRVKMYLLQEEFKQRLHDHLTKTS